MFEKLKMTELIIRSLSGFLFAYYFVTIAGIPNAIKKGFKYPPYKRMKPFDCVTCLSVWSSLAINLLLPYFVIKIIFYIFLSGFIGNKIK
jgi:hypothetical protein